MKIIYIDKKNIRYNLGHKLFEVELKSKQNR